MELVITGHFSYIDKWEKLVFTFLEDDTKDKLSRHCGNEHTPYTRREFTVSMPKNSGSVDEFIGLDCDLRVEVRHYSFASRTGKNKGEQVNGVKLFLTDIQSMAKYH